jgi:hypothetical protein
MPANLAALEFLMEETNMSTRLIELSQPQSFAASLGIAEEFQETHNSGIAQSNEAASNARLYRFASIAGIGSALILLVNAAKRSSVIATTDLTQLLAPLAEILALGLVVGLFLAFGRRTGLFGVIAFVAHFASLASLEGIEVVINLVFSKLPMSTIAELRDGPLGLLLTASSLLFLFSALAFVVSLAFVRGVPRIPLALYFIGVVPIALRAFVPEIVLDLGLVTLAASIVWLSGWLWVRANKDNRLGGEHAIN